MFDLTFLGTAASTPSAERGLPAVLVGVGSARFLIDCGEGTQRQLFRAGSGFRPIRPVFLHHPPLPHVLGRGGPPTTPRSLACPKPPHTFRSPADSPLVPA